MLQFQLDTPFSSEAQLERMLKTYLDRKGIMVKTQQSADNKRYDMLCFNPKFSSVICIELKIDADTSNVRQFDRYHKDFPDGFIILCWKATSSLKSIFESVKEQSPTPIALVELSMRCSMI